MRFASLGHASAASGQLAHLVEEDGALEGIQLADKLCNFSQKGVSGEDCRLSLVPCFSIAEKVGDVYLEGARETFERTNRRHGLSIFDLGDISARDAHATGELTLGEVTHEPQIADSCSYLEAGVFAGQGCGDDSESNGHGCRLFNVE